MSLTGDPGGGSSSPLCSGRCPVMVTHDKMSIFCSLVLSSALGLWVLSVGVGRVVPAFMIGGIFLCVCIGCHQRLGPCPLSPLAHLPLTWSVSSPPTASHLKHPGLSFSLPCSFPHHLGSCYACSTSAGFMLQLPCPLKV